MPLKKKLGANMELAQAPLTEGTLPPDLERVLLRRMKKRGNRAEMEILIKWRGNGGGHDMHERI